MKDLFISTIQILDFTRLLRDRFSQIVDFSFEPSIVAFTFNPETSQIFSLVNIAPGITILFLFENGNTTVANQVIYKLAEAPCVLESDTVASFKYLSDSEIIFLATKSGSIYTLNISDIKLSNPNLDLAFTLIGNFDLGIKSAEWSPDEEHLAIVTGEEKISLLNSEFDLDFETPSLLENSQTTDFVNVGWGSKQTQFHGKVGKESAQKPNIINSRISKNDDTLPRVSWRGDSSIFAVSFLGKDSREIQVYSSDGKFLAASEPIECLEHNLAWKPSGSVIVATEKLSHTYNVIFYERNGLRHYEFGLPKYVKKVVGLYWNSTSSILAVLAQAAVGGSTQTIIQLWTCGNYHWYLKQEILGSGVGGTVTNLTWDLENPYLLHLLASKPTNSSLDSEKLSDSYGASLRTESSMYIKICLGTVNHISKVASDKSSSVAIVTDNNKLLITPFGYSNVPPPMSLYSIDLSKSQFDSFSYTCRSVAMAGFGNGNSFVTILSNGMTIQLYNMCDSVKSVRLAKKPELLCEIEIPGRYINGNRFIPRQLVWPNLNQLVVLGSALESHNDSQRYCESILFINVDLDTKEIESSEIFYLNGIINNSLVLRIIHSPNADMILIATDDGCMYEVNLELPNYIQKLHVTVEEPTCNIDAILVNDSSNDLENFGDSFIDNSQNLGIISLSSKNVLRVNNALITPTCTSFYLRKDFLILTTTLNFLHFIPISLKLFEDPSLESSFDEKLKRRIERGAVIASVHPVSDSVVLQMPRGNLETIKPRALVLSNVVKFLDNLDFYSAFHTCRTNRVEFDIMYTHDYSLFADNIDQVIKQIDDVEHLCLLITSFGAKPNKDFPKVTQVSGDKNNNELSRAFRKALEKADELKYLQAIVTCYVCESPPAIEQSLLEIKKLGENSFELQSDSLNYLLFLVDLGHVYKAALGLYDLELALLVAQKGHSDPREYVSLLAKWNSACVDPNYQHFLIDLYLQRYQSAAQNLTMWYLTRVKHTFESGDTGDLSLAGFSIEDDTSLQDLDYNANLAKAWGKLSSFTAKHNLYEHVIKLIRPDNLNNTLRACIKESEIGEEELTFIVHTSKLTFAKLSSNYAQYLDLTKKDYTNAAAHFLLSGEYHNAITSYEKANKWSEALALATSPKARYTSHQVYNLATNLANNLVSTSSASSSSEALVMENSSKKYSDAAKIILEYTNLVELGVQYFTSGQLWSEAIRSCYRFSREDLIESFVYPKLISQHSEIMTSISEHQSNLEAKLARLEELRKVPLHQVTASLIPASGFKNGEIDIDVMSDTASMASQFSVFTIASATTANSSVSKSNRSMKSSKTSSSRMSSRNRKREVKKKLRGRKGTIYEESYLVESINRSVDQIRSLAQNDVPNMIFALLSFDNFPLANELSAVFHKLVETMNGCLGNVFDNQRQIHTGDVMDQFDNYNTGNKPLNVNNSADAHSIQQDQADQGESATIGSLLQKPAPLGGKWELSMFI